MSMRYWPALLGGMCFFAVAASAQFADRVIAYQPGTGYATEFGTGLGFTNAASALGAPSRVTPGQFGGPVDPFNPPYLREQLVSLGTNGSLTVQFDQPIFDDPAHAYGVDFLVFGSAGFMITNGNFTGGGITDGSLFGQQDPQSTRVWVSADDTTYYELSGSLAPVFDHLYPTDGAGDFQTPVDPSVAAADFAGLDLAGIRARYAGSGGGTGYDLAWARDGQGNPVSLDQARYVRLEVRSGRAEIDGLAVVPEPAVWRLGLAGGVGLLAWRGYRRAGRESRGAGKI